MTMLLIGYFRNFVWENRKEMAMRRFVKGFILFALFFIFISPVYVFADEIADLGLPSMHFPSMHIETQYNPFTVERTFWHDGTITFVGYNSAPARIRGRGNSTWFDGPDKRPLRFRLGEAGSMPNSDAIATDWILLSNHFDRSLLRNHAALHLAGSLDGLSFTPTVQHIHLYVNGEYMGVYLLTDERDTALGRLEIEWHEDPALSEFFIELDARAYMDAVLNEDFVEVNGLLYDVRFPGSSGRTPEHMAYVREYLESVSRAVRGRDFDEAMRLIDLDSFVDFYLVQELLKNKDVHSLSVFMHIKGQGAERRLFMGPTWDFDTAAGNFYNQRLGSGPEYLYVAVFNYWYRYLMSIPEFHEAVADRWREIRDREVAGMIAHVNDTARRYSADFERNFDRHPILNEKSFLEEAADLVNWLETRANWMDAYFDGRLYDYDPLWALVEFYRENPLNIRVNGVVPQFIVPPFVLQDRTMISVMEFGDLFEDVNVYYRPEHGEIVLTRGDRVASHWVGAPFMMVNGEMVEFGTPSSVTSSMKSNEHVFIPLSLFAQALGFEISWEADDRMVDIR